MAGHKDKTKCFIWLSYSRNCGMSGVKIGLDYTTECVNNNDNDYYYVFVFIALWRYGRNHPWKRHRHSFSVFVGILLFLFSIYTGPFFFSLYISLSLSEASENNLLTVCHAFLLPLQCIYTFVTFANICSNIFFSRLLCAHYNRLFVHQSFTGAGWRRRIETWCRSRSLYFDCSGDHWTLSSSSSVEFLCITISMTRHIELMWNGLDVGCDVGDDDSYYSCLEE